LSDEPLTPVLEESASLRVALLTALTITLTALAHPAAAAPKVFTGALAVGLGVSTERDVPITAAAAATLSAGAAYKVTKDTSILLQGTLTSGGELPAGRIPEAARPGSRRLATLTLGPQLSRESSNGTRFTSLGLGIGHAQIVGARGTTQSGVFVEPRRRVGVSLDASIGYRSGRQGPGLQVALLFHGLVTTLGLGASTVSATAGLAF